MSETRKWTRYSFAWRPGTYLRSSVLLTVWMVVRAAAQAATLLLLARTIGADTYGVFVAAIAVASLVSPMAGLGVASIVVRNGAMDPAHLTTYLRRAFHIWWPSTAVCIVMGYALAVLLLPSAVPWPAVLAALMVEVAATSLSELRARHAQAQQRMGRFGAFSAGPVLLRLAGLVVLLEVLETPGAAAVLWMHAGAGLLFVVAAWPRIGQSAGEPQHPLHATTGIPFALAAFASRVQGEFNKPVLARMEFALAGNYNAAQRAVEIFALPLAALQESLWPRLYALGDPRQKLRIAGAFLLACAFVLGGLAWWLAPWLPRVLGESFAPTVEVIRLLAWLPALQAIRGMANFFTVHAGHMQRMAWASLVGAGLNVLVVVWLVPAWGMRGAVTATYATELAMILILLTQIPRLQQK
jgi:O-antigen/teichoic acid export membrane protein